MNKSRDSILKQPWLKKLALLSPGVIAGLIVVVWGSVSAQAAKEITTIRGDVSSHELRSITVESWDRDYSNQGYGWRVFTNRELRPKGLEKKPYEWSFSNFQSSRQVKLIKGTPVDLRENRNYEPARVLALRYAFTFPGNNVVSIEPPDVDHYMNERVRYYLSEHGAAQSQPGQEKKSCYNDPNLSFLPNNKRSIAMACVLGVNLPGHAHKISMWVLGRGNDYHLEAWLEDWRGNVHVLKMGSINFIGWRPVSVDIPKSIPQDFRTYPQVKSLILKKFKLRSRANANFYVEEPTYIYFDELRILSNVFQLSFDGSHIDFDKVDCERKNNLYRILRQNSRNPDQWPPLIDCSKAPGPPAPIGQGQ